MAEKIPPVHPGEILREEFMLPMGLTSYRIAKDIGVPLPRIHDIVNEKRGISADTALRLGRYFGTTPDIWLNIQARYDLDLAEDRLGERLNTEVKKLQLA
ncbi:MAG: HigA family addiction module antidote protein [Planctomycetes bacterium]|nr:HigA family addiction module antidote protein [Planctomycetota bacterium]